MVTTTPMGDPRRKEQHLWDLARTFQAQAHAGRHRVLTRHHLKEYYTLLKLAVCCLQQLVNARPRTTLRLRIKAHVQLAKILLSDTDLGDDAKDSPESHLTQAIVLCGDTLQFQQLRFCAEYTLAKSAMAKGYTRHALAQITGSRFSVSLPFQLLRLQSVADPIRAHAMLVNMLQSTELQSCHQDTQTYFSLLEVSYAMSHGLLPFTDVFSIKTLHSTLSLVLMVLSSLASLYSTNDGKVALDPAIVASLMDLDSVVTLPMTLGDITLMVEVDLPPTKLLVAQIFIHNALTGLHLNTDSSITSKCLEVARETIASWELSPVAQLIRYNGQLLARAHELKGEIQFFEVFKSITSNTFSQKTDSSGRLGFEGIQTTNEKRLFPVLGPQLSQMCINLSEERASYLLAMAKQLYGSPKDSMLLYCNLVRLAESKPSFKYDELYLFSLLNLHLITQGCIDHFSRGSLEGWARCLFRIRTDVAAKLQRVMAAPGIFIRKNFNLDVTLQLISLVSNADNRTNEQCLAETGELFSKYLPELKGAPLLASLMLIEHTRRMNKTSDDKQKWSQMTYNMAKYPFCPLIRYVSGLNNLNNTVGARNMQQYKIQEEKLNRMIPNLEFVYGGMFDTMAKSFQ